MDKSSLMPPIHPRYFWQTIKFLLPLEVIFKFAKLSPFDIQIKLGNWNSPPLLCGWYVPHLSTPAASLPAKYLRAKGFSTTLAPNQQWTHNFQQSRPGQYLLTVCKCWRLILGRCRTFLTLPSGRISNVSSSNRWSFHQVTRGGGTPEITRGNRSQTNVQPVGSNWTRPWADATMWTWIFH